MYTHTLSLSLSHTHTHTHTHTQDQAQEESKQRRETYKKKTELKRKLLFPGDPVDVKVQILKSAPYSAFI